MMATALARNYAQPSSTSLHGASPNGVRLLIWRFGLTAHCVSNRSDLEEQTFQASRVEVGEGEGKPGGVGLENAGHRRWLRARSLVSAGLADAD